MERSSHFSFIALCPLTFLNPVLLVSLFFHSSSFHAPDRLAKPFATTYESIYSLTLGHFSLYKVDDHLKLCPLWGVSLATVLVLRKEYPGTEFVVQAIH